jgi:hypothetical protein
VFSREVNKIFEIGCTNIIAGVKIDINESIAIGARVDPEQTVLGFVEALDAIKLRSFDKTTFSIVGPTVVAASKYKGRAGRLFRYRVSSVTADVVEGADNTIFTQHDQDRKAGHV